MAEADSETESSFVFIIGKSKSIHKGYSRHGAEDDSTKIKNTFTELFKSEVHNWIDVPQQELIEKLRELKSPNWQNKFSKCKFVVVFLLLHGTHDGQVYYDKLDEILDLRKTYLNPLYKIEGLNKKLKWLVVQACRGDLNHYDKYETDGDPSRRVYPDYTFISYCTGEGTISYQRGYTGKIFIQEICKELELNAKRETLVQMLTNVNDAVLDYANKGNFENFARPCFRRNFDNYTFF